MSVQKPSYLFDKSGPENEISDLINSKGYLPNENNLPESTVMKSSGMYKIYHHSIKYISKAISSFIGH